MADLLTVLLRCRPVSIVLQPVLQLGYHCCILLAHCCFPSHACDCWLTLMGSSFIHRYITAIPLTIFFLLPLLPMRGRLLLLVFTVYNSFIIKLCFALLNDTVYSRHETSLYRQHRFKPATPCGF